MRAFVWARPALHRSLTLAFWTPQDRAHTTARLRPPCSASLACWKSPGERAQLVERQSGWSPPESV